MNRKYKMAEHFLPLTALVSYNQIPHTHNTTTTETSDFKMLRSKNRKHLHTKLQMERKHSQKYFQVNIKFSRKIHTNFI